MSPSPGAPLEHWWTAYNDPQLESLIQEALVNAPDARSARARLEEALATRAGALVQLSADEARVRLLTIGETQARFAYNAALKRYSYGIDDLTSTLSAERTWRVTRTALTAAEVQALRRSVTAFKALGGGWTPGPAPTQQAGPH